MSQILLDFSSPDEEDMDMFACSSVCLVTADRAHWAECFDTMDLRELYDFDKDYLTGAKAPLILRLPHARLRPNNSLCFDALFQLLVCLLVTSKLKNFETSSFFSYNDRTRNLSVPTQEKGICPVLLPERIKGVDKHITSSKSSRFVMHEPEHGLHLHKGFKMLTEVWMHRKPDWVEFNYRIHKPLLPVRMRLQKLT